MKLVSYQQVPSFLQKQSKNKMQCEMIVASFKRDRKIQIHKDNETYTLLTDGYEHEAYPELSEKEMYKLLKKKMKLEFPRSHKLYVDIHDA